MKLQRTIFINPKLSFKGQERERERERILELIGELPHVRVEPGDSGEGSRAYPDVDKCVRVGVWDAWVTSVRVPEILLHFRSRALLPSAVRDTLSQVGAKKLRKEEGKKAWGYLSKKRFWKKK
jgi:hypothetical protein